MLPHWSTTAAASGLAVTTRSISSTREYLSGVEKDPSRLQAVFNYDQSGFGSSREALYVEPDDVPESESEFESRARPEELRLLEAMLFASAEPIAEKELAERLPQGVDVHAALVRLGKQSLEVRIGTVARRHLAVVGNIIAGILERRHETRVDPDCAASQLTDIVKLLDDARDITDPIAIGVPETLRVDLVEDGVVEPRWHGAAFHGQAPSVGRGAGEGLLVTGENRYATDVSRRKVNSR